MLASTGNTQRTLPRSSHHSPLHSPEAYYKTWDSPTEDFFSCCRSTLSQSRATWKYRNINFFFLEACLNQWQKESCPIHTNSQMFSIPGNFRTCSSLFLRISKWNWYFSLVVTDLSPSIDFFPVPVLLAHISNSVPGIKYVTCTLIFVLRISFWRN